MEERALILFVRFRGEAPSAYDLQTELIRSRSSEHEPAGSYCGWFVRSVDAMRESGQFLVTMVRGAPADHRLATDAVQKVLGDRAHVTTRGLV